MKTPPSTKKPEASAPVPCSALVVSVTHRKADELRLRPREVWIDTWQVSLTVGNQAFDVGPKSETEAEAQWMAERLREALYRSGNKSTPEYPENNETESQVTNLAEIVEQNTQAD